MQKRRMEWNGWILPIVWLLSLVVYALLYLYACAIDGEWTTGFGITTLYYFMPQAFLFGVLFGRKEGKLWRFRWLLPVFYYALIGSIFSYWKMDGWFLVTPCLALVGLLLGVSVHQIRKRRWRRWEAEHPWNGERLLEKLRQ